MSYEDDQDEIMDSARELQSLRTKNETIMRERERIGNLCGEKPKEIESLRAEVGKAERERDEADALAYVPNIWICNECGLVLDQKHFDTSTGEVGIARIQEVPICLNDADHGGMHRQSWKDNANGHADFCDIQLDEITRFKSHIALLERMLKAADLVADSYYGVHPLHLKNIAAYKALRASLPVPQPVAADEKEHDDG